MPMVAGDKPGIMDILRETSEFDKEEIPVAEEIIDLYLESPGEFYVITVAKDGNTPLGYICFGPTPLTKSTWDIYWMAVRKEKRGLGIGGELLRFAEENICFNGGTLALVETSSKQNYLRTRRFYRGNGYRRTARILDFYSPGDHLFIFEKRF